MMEPPVPPNVDLQDFKFMPIDITRLFGSEFHANSDDATWRAGITLWLKSFHQIPAASLPADDVALARLAEFGRDQRSWRKIKDGALRGWTLCSDGRLYHKVVAEKALEAWIEKVAQRKVSGTGNAKRYKQEFDPAPFDADIATARDYLHAINPRSRMLARKGGKYAPGISSSPVGSSDINTEPPDGSDKPPNGSDAGAPNAAQNLPIRKVREDKESKSLNIENKYLSPGGGATDLAVELFFGAFPKMAEPDGVRRELGRRLRDGYAMGDILDGARRYAVESGGRAGEHVASPVRWLVDGRWRDGRRAAGTATEPSPSAGVRVERDSPQGLAWTEYFIATTGKGPQWFCNHVARYCPTEWPPKLPEPTS